MSLILEGRECRTRLPRITSGAVVYLLDAAVLLRSNNGTTTGLSFRAAAYLVGLIDLLLQGAPSVWAGFHSSFAFPTDLGCVV